MVGNEGKKKFAFSEKGRRKLGWGLCAAGPVLCYAVVELLNENNPLLSLSPGHIAWNLAWYALIFALFSLLLGRKRGCRAAFVAIWTLGFINHYTVRFRGRMLVPADILHVRTAANVVVSYDLTPDLEMLTAALVLALYFFLLGRALFPPREKRSRGRALITALPLVALAAVFLFSGLLPALNIHAAQGQTRSSGLLFNFMVSLRYSFLHEPEDYSEELVENVQEGVIQAVDGQEDAASTEQPVSKPTPTNIILIMNESLADYSVFPNFEISRDPLEFMHSLRENTISGYLYSPVFGGGTANVEYEVLTGNLCAFLPEGTVAYQNYIEADTPSLASLAKEAGYRTIAFHPFLASSWNREEAYACLGFDEQYYEKDIAEPRYVRDYISDACDFDEIRRITEEEDGRTFIFNVTMQNHGGYAMEWDAQPQDLVLSEELNAADPDAAQYFGLISYSDDAFEQLLAYYSSCGEPTLIAMFGDHQPSLDAGFYDALYGTGAQERSNEQALGQFVTPFVIWANYDIEEREHVNISANFFGLLVADAAGIARTYYMELVADTLEEVPVIHRLGYITADGNYVGSRSELSEEARQLLTDYELMAYYDLFDRDTGDDFYEPRSS